MRHRSYLFILLGLVPTVALALSLIDRDGSEEDAANKMGVEFDESSEALLLNSEWIFRNQGKFGNPGELLASMDRIEANALDLTDRRAVISHVLSGCSQECNVYPSEQYFYYKFQSGERLISGNLRFCDSSSGQVHFGYFDVYDREFLYHGTLDNRVKGVEIHAADERVSIRIDEIERVFVLAPPQFHGEMMVRNGEAIISPVLDESGFNFGLFFLEEGPRFFYALDPGAPLPDRLLPLKVGELEFFLGEESRFVFFGTWTVWCYVVSGRTTLRETTTLTDHLIRFRRGFGCATASKQFTRMCG